MHFTVVLDGDQYSAHKDQFKKIMKAHGLKWVGGPSRFLWTGEGDAVEAQYERDEERDVTLSATLTWRGEEGTPFLDDFKAWASELGGERVEVAEDAERERLERLVESELRFWESIHKPQVEALRKRGRPEEWIEQDLKRFEDRKRAKESELRAQYGLGGSADA